MKVAIGNTVWSTDHRNIGTVRDLVLDADQQRVCNMIIEPDESHCGTIEIPLERLTDKTEDRGSITLDYTAAELDTVFKDKTLNPGFATQGNVGDCAQSPVPLPAERSASAIPVPAAATESSITHGDIPADASPTERPHLVTISAGSVVIAADGSPFGKLARLAFESLTGAPLWLVVRRGYLFREELCLGASSIAAVTEDTLYIDTVDTPDAPWVRSPGLILF